MSPVVIGLAAGIALGFAGAFGGLVAFIVVAVCGAAGLLVGAVYDGRVDLTEYLSGRAGRDRRDRRRLR